MLRPPFMRLGGWLTLVASPIAATTVMIFRPGSRHKAPVVEAAPPVKTASIAAVPASQSIERESQLPKDQVAFEPSDLASFATLADAGVAELREGITLEQWSKAQKNIEDWRSSKDEAFFDCRTFLRTETLTSGRKIRHLVYFYPPDVPAQAVFPDAGGDDLLNHDCKLSMIRVQTEANTDRDGHAFESALQQQFMKEYGDSIGMKGTRYARYPEAAHWMPGSEILSAYDPQPQRSDDDPDDATGGEVFVLARLANVREIEQDSCCRIEDHYHSIEESQFRQALAIAAADSALTDRIATLFRHLFLEVSFQPLSPAEGSDLGQSREALLPALRDWLNTIKSLPPVRHAAGLYVADRLMVAAGDNGWRDLIEKENTDLRAAFEKLGATFEYEELGACYGYSGSWLTGALALDPEGPVGQMSVLVSLARGGAPKLPKDKGKELDIFHTVISDGDWLLSKKPDAATAAQIHFILGDANATIFALAGGAETEYGDPKEYEAEAPAARHNALEHYRAGLAIDATSVNARYSWLQAWKISAGLLPKTRWVYIYD